MNKWVFFWLLFVAGWYLIPWWNKVYFLWDDIELLLRFRHPVIETFLSSHQYQFFPVFKLLYWAETKIFGVNPAAFLAVSVTLHIINIRLIHLIVKTITGSNYWGLISAILVSFNKSYFTVIFWPTIQAHVMLTTFSLFSLLILLRIKENYSIFKTFLLFICLASAGLSIGFGIGAGAMFSVFGFFFLMKKISKLSVIVSGILASLMPILGIILYSSREIGRDGLLQLSFIKIWNILYFTAVGPTQGIISRFLIPGFTPDIYSLFNISIMIILPATVLGLIIWIIYKTAVSRQIKLIYPLLFFGSLTVMPYFIASLARSGPGALGALAERYVYFPLFFFVLAFIYSLFLTEKIMLNGKKTKALKRYLTVIAVILSAGHQLLLFIYTNNLFI